MAIEYGSGKAGQYAKSQAQKRLERFWSIYIYVMVIVSGLVGVCLGFIVAQSLARHFGWTRYAAGAVLVWAPLAAEALVILACLLLIRMLRKPMDSLVVDRIKWLRGGQAEGLVAWQLRDLDDRWHFFNNVKLKTGGDLDHVLIGPGGVFCLSTKSHRGTYCAAESGTYLLNGEPTDQLAQAKIMALKLRNWFEVKLHEAADVNVPWVQPVLVVPFARVEFSARQHIAWVMDDTSLIEALNTEPRRLSTKAIETCVDVLRTITHLAPKSGHENKSN